MTEWNPPDVCDAGHPMRYPNVKVGWVQCGCAKATGRPPGHRYELCLTCKAEWRENGCDNQRS